MCLISLSGYMLCHALKELVLWSSTVHWRCSASCNVFSLVHNGERLGLIHPTKETKNKYLRGLILKIFFLFFCLLCLGLYWHLVVSSLLSAHAWNRIRKSDILVKWLLKKKKQWKVGRTWFYLSDEGKLMFLIKNCEGQEWKHVHGLIFIINTAIFQKKKRFLISWWHFIHFREYY